MPSLTLSPGRMIWFAHCPKAGGTSVERMLVETWGPAVGHLHWGWDRWWRAGGWRKADPPNSPQHLIWEDAVPAMKTPPAAVFALVRAPLARMQSEQRFQARHRRGTVLGKVLARLPFSLWLRVMMAVVARNPYAFDNHLRPQADFVPEGARVFHLEDGMEAVTAWLEQATGRPLAAPLHLLATNGPRACADARDAALVAACFAADYDRFGYGRADGDDVEPKRSVLDALARMIARPVTALERRGRI